MENLLQGKIIKGIAGFYYVHLKDKGVYECKAKGIFRNKKVKPLVGDRVLIKILSEDTKTGNIEEILKRSNSLIRPAVANVDQAVVIFAAAKPTPNLNLLDRFLILMEKECVDTIICFNKKDLCKKEQLEELLQIYQSAGYRVLFTSASENEGINQLKDILRGKTTTVAGPSGVGKSSLINCLQEGVLMATGSISTKIERGKHTTRHSELITMEDCTYIVDTPGFSSIELTGIEKEELQEYFIEFGDYEKKCRFQGCAHIHEPDCGVKEALEHGEINKSRYENYIQLYEELKNKRRY